MAETMMRVMEAFDAVEACFEDVRGERKFEKLGGGIEWGERASSGFGRYG